MATINDTVIYRTYPSKSTPGRVYTAWVDPATGDQGCNCWPFKNSGFCPHISATLATASVELAQNLILDIGGPPAAEPEPSGPPYGLTLTARGDLVTDRGEILSADNPETAMAVMGETLQTYAHARRASDALSFQIADREIELGNIIRPEQEALDAKLESLYEADPLLIGARAKLAEARQTVMDVEATLATMFIDRKRGAILDIGAVRVAWPKPRETVSLSHPPSWYSTPVAQRDLSAELVREHQMDPIDAANYARTMLEWLSPTAKISAPAAPQITIRSQ